MAAIRKPPPGVDLAATRYPLLLGVGLSCWALGFIAIALRIVCRRITKSRLWLDDWLIIASMPSTASTLAINLCWKGRYGLGRHIWATPPEALMEIAKARLVNKFFYCLSLSLIKLSIIALYWRFFSTSTFSRPLIWTLAVIVLAWEAAAIVGHGLNCFPYRAFWERFDPVHPMPAKDYVCPIETKIAMIGYSVPNIITDAFLVLLPIIYTQRLRLHLSQRVAVFCTFAGGFIVVTLAITRTVVSMKVISGKSTDMTWDQARDVMFSTLEVNMGTVCACLPILRPILNLVIYGSVQAKSPTPPPPEIETITLSVRDQEQGSP